MFKKETINKIIEPKSQKINVNIDPAKKVYNRTVYEVGSHRKNSVITTDNTITIENLPFAPLMPLKLFDKIESMQSKMMMMK